MKTPHRKTGSPPETTLPLTERLRARKARKAHRAARHTGRTGPPGGESRNARGADGERRSLKECEESACKNDEEVPEGKWLSKREKMRLALLAGFVLVMCVVVRRQWNDWRTACLRAAGRAHRARRSQGSLESADGKR